MEHIIKIKEKEIIDILNRFFTLGYSRNDLPFKDKKDNDDAFKFASRIYKRGFSAIQNITLLPQLHIKNKENFIKELEIFTNKNCFFILDKGFIEKQKELIKILKNDQYTIYEPSESTKSINTVLQIVDEIPQETKSIFGLGGGITLDISGFIAGILNLPINYLATTLLSAIDAAIGGKTGVNFPPYGKNQIGLFYGVDNLYVVPDFFITLSKQNIHCGLAEALKHSWIYGTFESEKHIFKEILEEKLPKSLMDNFVRNNFKHKALLIKEDPYETLEYRSALNFGHTLAHVLESLSEEKFIEYSEISLKIANIQHGIAVAHGMNFIFKNNFLSPKKEFSNILIEIIKSNPLKLTGSKNIVIDRISHLLSHDKKNTSLSNKEQVVNLSLPSYSMFAKGFKPESKILHPIKKRDLAEMIYNYINEEFII